MKILFLSLITFLLISTTKKNEKFIIKPVETGKALTFDSITQEIITVNFANYSIAAFQFNKFVINNDSLVSIAITVNRFVKNSWQYYNPTACIGHGLGIKDAFDSVLAKDTLSNDLSGTMINTAYSFKPATQGLVPCNSTSIQYTDSNTNFQSYYILSGSLIEKDKYEGILTTHVNFAYRNSLSSYSTNPAVQVINNVYYDSAVIIMKYYYLH